MNWNCVYKTSIFKLCRTAAYSDHGFRLQIGLALILLNITVKFKFWYYNLGCQQIFLSIRKQI